MPKFNYDIDQLDIEDLEIIEDSEIIEDLEIVDLGKPDDGIEFLEEEQYMPQDYVAFDEPEEEAINVALDNKVDYVDIHRQNTQKPTLISELISYVKIFVIAFIIAFIFTRYVIINAQVPTGSMQNTIMAGDKLVGLRLSYLFSSPKRGDIIIFKYPVNEKENFVKRVIGVPGDVVQIISGSVYVNGELLKEDYLLEPMTESSENYVYIVPEDSYFVLGDNRNFSHDSRYWVKDGVPCPYVHKKQILAKASFRYYNGATKRIDFKTL